MASANQGFKATPDFVGATNGIRSRTLMIMHIDIQMLP